MIVAVAFGSDQLTLTAEKTFSAYCETLSNYAEYKIQFELRSSDCMLSAINDERVQTLFNKSAVSMADCEERALPF